MEQKKTAASSIEEVFDGVPGLYLATHSRSDAKKLEMSVATPELNMLFVHAFKKIGFKRQLGGAPEGALEEVLQRALADLEM